MSAKVQPVLREELLARRERLLGAIEVVGHEQRLSELLGEVDAALDRMERGSYGLCEVCGDPVESDRLLANPLERFCLGDLTAAQKDALEQDLRLAVEIQRTLLPKTELDFDGWEFAYHYRPAAVVSGDYCDVMTHDGGELMFVLGDVSGKGVAASMLMSQLHATFHALGPTGLATNLLVAQASRIFCESTLASHFATLVCARAQPTGEVELCNAGHLPALLVQGGRVTDLGATGLPIGLFANEEFDVRTVELAEGDALVLFTDGLVESCDGDGREYGLDRVRSFVAEHPCTNARDFVGACLDDLAGFQRGGQPDDDLTAMVLRRTAGRA